LEPVIVQKRPTLYPTRGIPINTPTRGEQPEIQQVGILTDGNEKIIPLYGRPTWRGSNKWIYYTSTDKFNFVKLPVHDLNGKNCTEEYGCTEFSDKDQVDVPAYNKTFSVTTYAADAPRYIPYL
jgi:hypothetical protein